MKTSELVDDPLDFAVAKCNGKNYTDRAHHYEYSTTGDVVYLAGGCSERSFPSSDWSEGGPIIEREQITVKRYNYPTRIDGNLGRDWLAYRSNGLGPHVNEYSMWGPTPLIAAMRCYVASKLGDDVDIPEELLK